jgi:enoyl-CoA hydratase/carnithine racemase
MSLVTTENHGATRHVVLNRPEKRNAMNQALLVELGDALRAAAMPKPVVCQIHRACFGGALEVALGCDLRIAADDAQLGLPEVKFGIIPDVGGSTRLPAVVGLGRAKELIMTAATIDAAEAHRIGLVNRVAPAAELDSAVQALVDELLANSHVAVGRAKRVLDASARPALATTLELEVAVQEYCVAAMREAAQAAAETETVAAG